MSYFKNFLYIVGFYKKNCCLTGCVLIPAELSTGNKVELVGSTVQSPSVHCKHLPVSFTAYAKLHNFAYICVEKRQSALQTAEIAANLKSLICAAVARSGRPILNSGDDNHFLCNSKLNLWNFAACALRQLRSKCGGLNGSLYSPINEAFAAYRRCGARLRRRCRARRPRRC